MNLLLAFKNAVCFLLVIISISSSGQELKVMTYNIRYNNPNDGINSWPNRKASVFRLIKKQNPDVFCVQEALHDQMKDLEAEFSDYHYVGVGRDDGKEKGEYCAIFYKLNRLSIVMSKPFWLSDTPSVPGSIGWDAAITRMAMVATLEEKKSKKQFVLITSHFDHQGKNARMNSAIMLSGWIRGFQINQSLPVIVCGDFNFEPTEEAYSHLITKDKDQLKDARPAGYPAPTFCGFEKKSSGCKIIDYVLHSAEWSIKNFAVIDENNGTYYPSDHLPVVSVLALK